jgi:2-phosphoglycerate kinase
MEISDPKTRELFAQAYILGGSPCSGKSTIAERLSKEFDLHDYKVDDYEREHLARADPERHPTMHTYAKMDWDEVWMRPPQQQVEEEFAFYWERFEMVVQDLAAYSGERPLLLEGAALLPDLLEQNGVDAQRVMFLVPTKAFQLHHYSQRPWIKQILRNCDDPEQAFENWMMRDHLFGQEILRQAKARHYETLVVDGNQSVDEQYEKVKAHLMGAA